MGAFLVCSRKSDDNAKVTIKSDDKGDDKTMRDSPWQLFSLDEEPVLESDVPIGLNQPPM